MRDSHNLVLQVYVCSLPSTQEVWHHGTQPHTILGQLLGCKEDGEHGLLQPQFSVLVTANGILVTSTDCLAFPCDWKSRTDCL